jgi:hypothetical protein
MASDFSCQFYQRELLEFSLQIKLHAIIQLGVSLPSFNTSAQNWVLCGSQQSHYSLNKFGLAKVWTRVYQLTHWRSIHLNELKSKSVHDTSKPIAPVIYNCNLQQAGSLPLADRRGEWWRIRARRWGRPGTTCTRSTWWTWPGSLRTVFFSMSSPLGSKFGPGGEIWPLGMTFGQWGKHWPWRWALIPGSELWPWGWALAPGVSFGLFVTPMD